MMLMMGWTIQKSPCKLIKLIRISLFQPGGETEWLAGFPKHVWYVPCPCTCILFSIQSPHRYTVSAWKVPEVLLRVENQRWLSYAESLPFSQASGQVAYKHTCRHCNIRSVIRATETKEQSEGVENAGRGAQVAVQSPNSPAPHHHSPIC